MGTTGLAGENQVDLVQSVTAATTHILMQTRCRSVYIRTCGVRRREGRKYIIKRRKGGDFGEVIAAPHP